MRKCVYKVIVSVMKWGLFSNLIAVVENFTEFSTVSCKITMHVGMVLGKPWFM